MRKTSLETGQSFLTAFGVGVLSLMGGGSAYDLLSLSGEKDKLKTRLSGKQGIPALIVSALLLFLGAGFGLLAIGEPLKFANGFPFVYDALALGLTLGGIAIPFCRAFLSKGQENGQKKDNGLLWGIAGAGALIGLLIGLFGANALFASVRDMTGAGYWILMIAFGILMGVAVVFPSLPAMLLTFVLGINAGVVNTLHDLMVGRTQMGTSFVVLLLILLAFLGTVIGLSFLPKAKDPHKVDSMVDAFSFGFALFLGVTFFAKDYQGQSNVLSAMLEGQSGYSLMALVSLAFGAGIAGLALSGAMTLVYLYQAKILVPSKDILPNGQEAQEGETLNPVYDARDAAANVKIAQEPVKENVPSAPQASSETVDLASAIDALSAGSKKAMDTQPKEAKPSKEVPVEEPKPEASKEETSKPKANSELSSLEDLLKGGKK